ncbi:MAG TPA: hypothetical protein VMF89_10990 [Polyangiales bacterium]|nr:hypothetical protein [Polyangiales bacterium]
MKWHVLAILFCAACGGDDDSSGGVVTGLPSEQKLSTLSDADVKKACQSVNDGASVVITPTAIKRVFCLEFAAPEAVTYSSAGKVSVDVAKCQQLVDTCVSNNEDEDDDLADVEVEGVNECDEANANDLNGCDATVGEYEACINAVLGEMQRMLSELTCQNAEKISSEEYSNDLDPAALPQCQTVMAKCPDTSLGIPFTN